MRRATPLRFIDIEILSWIDHTGFVVGWHGAHKKRSWYILMDDQEKKIKDLEESLARELDQQVNLSAPTDSRIQGAVELNPTLNPKADTKDEKKQAEQPEPGVEAAAVPTYEPVPKQRPPEELPEDAKAKAGPQEIAEVSLEELDKILSQEMPELEGELKALREVGEDPDVKNADLSAFDVDEHSVDVTPEVGDAPPRKLALKELIKRKLNNGFNWTMDFLYRLPINLYKYIVKFFREDLKNFIIGSIYKLDHVLTKAVEWFKELPWIQKLAAISITLISATLVALLFGKIPALQVVRVEIHEGFAHGADEELKFNADAQFVPLSEEGQYPEHVVLLQRVVVNIKPSESSGPNPMVGVRFYFELSTREGAVEVKDREKEMRDLSQRVLETFTYDQIISAHGKQLLKEVLRREISAVLNNGVVKTIFIDDILIKP